MTIAELLGRIGLAFERMFYLVILGEFGDLVLSDLGIIALIVVVSFPIFLFVGAYVLGSVFEAIGSVFEAIGEGGKADLPQAERPWGYECNQCGCTFDRDPAGDDECPDCGSDDLSRQVF